MTAAFSGAGSLTALHREDLASAALATLRASLPQVHIVVRRTRRSLLGLHRTSGVGLVLRIHPELLYDTDCAVCISEWVSRCGRGGAGNPLRDLLRRTSARIAMQTADDSADWAAGIQTIGSDAAALLPSIAQRIHAAWFSDLPSVPVRWGRSPPNRRLTHLRFGCYRRQHRRIELSPRLAMPWVALIFVEHVLHHEYCHHRQAMMAAPRRERVHSPRFRAWERSFPGFAVSRRWEALALPWLLDGTVPPWYRPNP